MGGIPYQMAGIPERGTLCRADEVVGTEIIYLFIRRDYRFFCCSSVTGIGCRGMLLCPVVHNDSGDHCKDADLGRPGVWVAVISVYYFYGKWNPAFLYGNRRRISVQDLSGDKAQADFYSKRFQRGEGGRQA